MEIRTDPGECLICGAAFCACTDAASLEVVQLPARDAAAALTPKAAEVQTTLPPDQFTSGTYRGRKGKA